MSGAVASVSGVYVACNRGCVAIIAPNATQASSIGSNQTNETSPSRAAPRCDGFSARISVAWSGSRVKILAITSSLDLSAPFSCTPSWWQLLKGLYEEGADLLVMPYQGQATDTLWWRGLPNPCATEG